MRMHENIVTPHTHVSHVPHDIHRCHDEPPILLSNNTSGTRDEVNMMWRINVKLPFPDENLVITRVFKDVAFGSRITSRGNAVLWFTQCLNNIHTIFPVFALEFPPGWRTWNGIPHKLRCGCHHRR